jgi:anti-sigma factor ChrR (cupin superfamily)/CheY-like chemotaxis protein
VSQTIKAGPALIVEDEFLVAMHVETVLEDLGFSQIEWANTVAAAERSVERARPTFAVLDINIGPDLVFPVAERLRTLGIPFVFSSGGGAPPAEWAQHPLNARALAAALETLGALSPAGAPAATLGDVIYANSRTAPPEQEWLTLVQSVAAGDEIALHHLYERAHQPVLTLLTRITGSRETAEELAIDVFHDVWRHASKCDVQNSGVLGWIMNLARAHGLERLRLENAHNPTSAGADQHPKSARTEERLQTLLSLRIARDSGRAPIMPPAPTWREPEWEAVAPGIECKLLAADAERHRVTMLVRLEPGASYPPHTHAGAEELHLLEGELWIDDRKLYPGDYNYGAPGATDHRVWSETGCSCVLITSTKDVLQ